MSIQTAYGRQTLYRQLWEHMTGDETVAWKCMFVRRISSAAYHLPNRQRRIGANQQVWVEYEPTEYRGFAHRPKIKKSIPKVLSKCMNIASELSNILICKPFFAKNLTVLSRKELKAWTRLHFQSASELWWIISKQERTLNWSDDCSG